MRFVHGKSTATCFKVRKPSIRRGFKLLEKSSLWQVDEAKSALGEAIEVNDVDDEEDLAGPSNVATSEKITESMQFLTASLHQFQQRAEEIHVEVQSSLKRPRLTSPESMDANMPPPNAEASGDGSASASTPAALQPFGAAGRQ